jgi:hypothetical protein
MKGKNTMTNDIFTLGIGRVIASGYAMRQCIPYLSWAYRKPLQWIKSNGIQLRKVIYVNYEPVSEFLEKNTMAKAIQWEVCEDTRTEDTRTEDEIREQLWEDDDSVETDEENCEWYRQRASEFEFHPMLSTCCYCGEREACYNGITSAVTDIMKDDTAYNGVIFQFCKICRDELQMIKLQTKASRL